MGSATASRRFLRHPRLAACLIWAALAGLGVVFVSAAVAIGPFTSGTTGFDVSYPNCTSTLPSGDAFAVVGLTHGRPFTTYSCASSLWAAARAATNNATPSAYFNTGYAGAYAKDIAGPCPTSVASAGVFSGLSGHTLSQAQQAWEIGCSEAYFASTHAPGTPALWFADVETGNSWSTNVTLNRFAIDGLSYEMQALGGGGMYSSPVMWSTITGSASWGPTPAAEANWVTGQGGVCPSSSPFNSASPTWLSQGAAVNGVDGDLAC
jgi:hypothetical protein